MTAIAETYEHAGVKVEIHYEEFDQSHADPREHDNLGVMYLYRPGYELGDEQLDAEGLPEIDCPKCDAAGYFPDEDGEPDCERCCGLGRIENPTIQEWIAANDVRAIAPLFIFEHSMMSISAGKIIFPAEEEITPADTNPRGRFMGDDAGWDTSFSGFLVITNEKLREEGMEQATNGHLTEVIESEVAEYDKYLRGEVFWYRVAPDTPFEDACHGFLGDDYIKEEANNAAEYAARQIAKEARERADWAARGVMTSA